MMTKEIIDVKPAEKNKYLNLSKPRTLSVELNSSGNLKKSYSQDDTTHFSKLNKTQNSNNSPLLEQEKKKAYINNSYQSDSIIKNNNAPSSTSSLVDKDYRDFIFSAPVKKQHFDPNNFVNSNSSLYINSDSLIKSNNTSIYSISSFNENYNVIFILFYFIFFYFFFFFINV